MVSKKKVKSKNGVRFDSKHIRLRTGESEKDNGTYVYRWTDKVGLDEFQNMKKSA